MIQLIKYYNTVLKLGLKLNVLKNEINYKSHFIRTESFI